MEAGLIVLFIMTESVSKDGNLASVGPLPPQ